MQAPVYAAPFDLLQLPEKGMEVRLEPTPKEREAIAAWLGILALESLSASVNLTRRGKDQYALEAHFEADVVQACVITLEPVPAHLKGEFQRAYRVVSRTLAKAREGEEGGEIGLESDEPELIQSHEIDLAAPLLEELSLSLDPYPKRPGAAFEVQEEASSPSESPFAALAVLKGEGAPSVSGTDPEPPGKGKRKPK